MADVVAAGNVRQRFITGIAARDGFAALVRCQFARAAEQHTMDSRALAAFTGAGNDQVPLEFGEPTKHRQNQPPMGRGGVRRAASLQK